MKVTYLIIFLLLFNNSYAQFGPQQIITTSAGGTFGVYSTDIDGDGDMDVLSTSSNSIEWYENIDGQGNFSPQQSVTTFTSSASLVYSADIDGDGDMDVISASYPGDKIVWNENIDGQGNFGPQQIISAFANGPSELHATDLDGDGDIDVLSALAWEDKIVWYENIDGQGNFGSQQIIMSNEEGASSVYTTDIDDDGDIDVVSSSDVRIAWYENTDGQGNFGSQQIIDSDANNARDVYAADLDGDGDMDVLSDSNYGDKIGWYENTDGQGSFSVQQIISTNVVDIRSIHATDLDEDGDMDVLSASYWDNKIAWYENADGQGNFSVQQIISTNTMAATSVYAADIDGNGVIDVLSASFDDNKIAWYENLHPLGVNENALLVISVFPNPVKEVLNILTQNGSPISSIQVFDILGRLVIEEKHDFNKVDVSNLGNGLLFLKIQTTEGVVTKKIIKE